MFPAIQLHRFYSIGFSKDTCILFEDLSLIAVQSLQNVLASKQLGVIEVVPDLFYINTSTKTISIVAHALNDSTYFITKQSTGSNIHLPCPYSNEYIRTTLECLVHIYENHCSG